MSGSALAVALVHHPIVDKRGDQVVTAVTNLDLHDIARTARTYGVRRFYVITPAVEQLLLVERILQHWREGHGASYNPHRGEALALIETATTLEAAIAAWSRETGAEAMPILTGAKRSDGVSFEQCRQLRQQHPLLLVFGTGWGLAPEIFTRGWTVLEPIRGAGDYNHLPVRSAAAIILDRLHAEP
ncbi:RNA methyltransferase [Trichloromonas sp.]|uniref:RNA methyltransferase n=1 Tax=Trichloromonas sp. TaxID=3069249 RepID=UPI003D81AF44